jgi:hypothetical protein
MVSGLDRDEAQKWSILLVGTYHCCYLDWYCTSIHQLYFEIQLAILEIYPISASNRATVSNPIDLSSAHQMCKPVDPVHLLAAEFDRQQKQKSAGDRL